MQEGHEVGGERPDEGLSSADVMRFLRAQYRWIIALMLLGAVVGALLSFLRPREWEATSVLRIGQVDDGGTVPRPIESPLIAAQRIQLQSFVDQVLQTLSSIPDAGRSASVVRDSLTAENIPATEMVKISVRALSPLAAAAALEVAQKQLLSIHDGLLQISLKQLHDRLDEINAQIAQTRAKHDRTIAPRSFIGDTGASGAGATNALLSIMLDLSDKQFDDLLAERQRKVIEQLSPDHTFPTKPLSAVAVSRNPISLGPIRPGILGAVVGLLCGLLVGASRHARRGRTVT